MNKCNTIPDVINDIDKLGVKIVRVFKDSAKERGLTIKDYFQYYNPLNIKESQAIIESANRIMNIFESHECNDIGGFLDSDSVHDDDIWMVYNLISEMEFMFVKCLYRHVVEVFELDVDVDSFFGEPIIKMDDEL